MDSDSDADLYRTVTDLARDTPSWVHHLAATWTEAGLLLFGALFVVSWWRRRQGVPRVFAIAVLAPVATAVAYVCSELLKTAVDEDRPCRAVPGTSAPIVGCPPPGDWSFPSNHATIAGAATVTLALAWRGILWLTAPMALLMAFSRVFVGVHYPHDVVAGLVLGALVAFAFVRLSARPATGVAEAMRGSSARPVRWFVGPGPTPSSYSPYSSYEDRRRPAHRGRRG
jgi:undecaprenyl-diphosphatase